MTEESTPACAPGAATTRTIRLLLEYDGSDFVGWQSQPSLRTVQGTIEAAVRQVLDEPGSAVVGAGRTDSGAHALGQVAHVRTASSLGLAKILAGLNTVLPRDLRVRSVADVPASFHARYSATAKEYRYHIWQGGPVPPFLHRYCYAVRGELDVLAMAAAARLFEGTHDLQSFRAAGCTAKSSIRTVTGSRVERHGSLVVYAVTSRGFLQHMVRIISGTLVKVGRGALAVGDVGEIIAARDRARAPATAPSQGLFLVRVAYAGDDDLAAIPQPVLACSLPAN